MTTVILSLVDNIIFNIQYDTARFNIPLRSFQGRFYRSDDPTISIIAPQDNGQLMRPIPPGSCKVKNVIILKIRSITKTEDTAVLG